MKFLSFELKNKAGRHLGIELDDNRVFNLTAYRDGLSDADAQTLPSSLEAFVAAGDGAVERVAALAAHPAHLPYVIATTDIRYLPPLIPSKNVFCVGRNYREHIIEGNIANGRPANSFPEAIEFFTKPPTTIVGHEDNVLRHGALTHSLDYEVELAIVIGKRGRDITEADAMDYVFGFTILNDITARDLQKKHGQWFKGKGLDTTCPIGPVITHKSAIPNPNAIHLSLDVNGEERQSANTDEMIFSIQAVIAQLSAGMTLEPGDIISTGTPKGVGFAAIPPRCLNVGDVVTAKIDGIGALRNTIVT